LALPTQRFAIAFARGARIGVLMIRTPGPSEHRVEGGGELGVSVPDQELQAISAILQVHHQVPGPLGNPFIRGVGSDPGQMHTPGAVLDEEQHIQAPRQHGVHVEEFGCKDRLGLGTQEVPPGVRGPPGCGVDAAERASSAIHPVRRMKIR
jgi:hypothetical protein